MNFKRAAPPGIFARLRDILWPRMGLRRLLEYYKRRMVRLPGTPHSIAAGFAAGAAVSFTPFMGFHFLMGALLAYVLRGNLVASALGTLVGNPWTFPLIWFAIYELGTTILSGSGTAVEWEALTFSYLADHIGDVLVPMMLGGLIMSLIVWPLFYFPLLRMIERFRQLRFERRQKRRKAANAVAVANGKPA